MKKTFALLLAFVLVITAAIGGTIAWLTDSTDEVKNTFTTSGIAISLTETWNAKSDDTKDKNDIWQVKMVPGYEYTKDPVVTVDGTVTTEDIYLFVKFEETGSTNYLTYTSLLDAENDEGKKEWTKGTGTEGDVPANVWYRVVKASDTTKSWHLLEGDKVAIKDSLTKENMTDDNFTAPQLKYTAYACQLYKNATETFTAAEAWAKVNPST